MPDSICLSYGYLPPVKLTIDKHGVWKKRHNGKVQGTKWEGIYKVNLVRTGIILRTIARLLNRITQDNTHSQGRKPVYLWIHIFFKKDGVKYRLEIIPSSIRYGPEWHPFELGYGERILGVCAQIIEQHLEKEIIHEYRHYVGTFVNLCSFYTARRKLKWENAKFVR